MPASESRMPASSSTMRMLYMFGYDGRWRRFWHKRKLYDKTRADRMIFFHANRAMVIFHDPAHDREAEPGTAPFRGEVRQKQLLLQFSRDAVTGIGDRDLNRVAACD